MKSLFLRTTFALVCSLAISAPTWADTLKIGTDRWPPFREIKNNQVFGIDDDLWQALSQQLNITIEYVRCPWKRCLDLMQAGKLDAMSGLAWRADRASYIDYIQPPYFQCSTRFYVRRNEASRLQRAEDLNALTIGMVRGSAYYPAFDNDNSLKKVQLPQEEVLLPMLATGRIDAYIGTDCQADFELANSSWLPQIVKAPFSPGNHTPLYIGISKKSAWQTRSGELAAGLQQIVDQGFQSSVMRHYYQNTN